MIKSAILPIAHGYSALFFFVGLYRACPCSLFICYICCRCLPKQSHVGAAHWSTNARWSDLGFALKECFFFYPIHTTPPKHRPVCLNLLQNTTTYVVQVQLVGLRKLGVQYGWQATSCIFFHW